MRSRYYVETGCKELKKIFTKEEKQALTESDVWAQISAAGGAQFTTTVIQTNDIGKAKNAFSWAKDRLVWQEFSYGRLKWTSVSYVRLEEVVYDDDGDEDNYVLIKDAVALPPEVCDYKRREG